MGMGEPLFSLQACTAFYRIIDRGGGLKYVTQTHNG